MKNLNEKLSRAFGRAALVSLFVVSATYLVDADTSTGPGIIGSIVSILHGGTGSTTASGARANLGITATGADTTYAYRANNGSDFSNVSTFLTNVGVEVVRSVGDVDTTIAATDKIVFINANFTTAHTWTLPQASTVNNGHEIILGDRAGTISATNTLTIAPFSGDSIRSQGASSSIVLNEFGAEARCKNVNSSFWLCSAIESMASKSSTLYALLASPALTGTPTAPTQTAGNNTTRLATTAFVATSFAPLASPALTGSPTAPTQTTADSSTDIATDAFVKAQLYATLASPSLTGSPTAPTQSAADNSTKLATTAFDTTAIANFDTALLAAANNWSNLQSFVSGTVDATTYCWHNYAYGGNSHQSAMCGQTTASVTTSPVTIYTNTHDGNFLIINGYDGSSAKFCDIVIHNGIAATFTVISSTTVAGSPAARTYSNGTLGTFKLTMASGLYGVNVGAMQWGGR